MKRAAILVFFTFLLFYSFTLIRAATCDTADCGTVEECQQKQEECWEIWGLYNVANEKNKEKLAELRKRLSDIEKMVHTAEVQINELESDVFDREVELGYQKEIFNSRVRSYYKRSYQFSPLLLLLSSTGISELTRELSYRRVVTNEDKKIVVDITQDLLELKNDKQKLEENRTWLAKTQAEIDEAAQFLGGEVAKTEAYMSEISSKIAQLSVKQEQLLAQKLASLNLPPTLGAGPLVCVDDRDRDPGFRPAFAFYTYGIPHRVGMNQYGAYGRAKAGQSYRDILNAYYEGITIEKKPNINIKVQGYGEMPLEQYLLGVYEMPESWPIEAQKAQAVAARSYALAYTDNGAKEICTTQQCQVYKGGNKGGNWEAAVKATEGEVAVHSGQAITAWYASTAGGYTFFSSDVGWSHKPWTKRMRDTSGDVASFSDLQAKAYDKDSPCFYAAQGWRKEYASSAWLKSEEVADIVDVLLLAKADSSIQKHLPQVDKPNPDGVETWDAGRIKQELKNRGITPFSNVSDVSVGWDKGMGRTTAVTVSGDGGTKTFEGPEFKNFFNLRAPANIQIVGPLFNIEKK